MYRVMLVDDDYPVLEFLQKTIPWGEMEMTVIGAFTDGQRALEHAKKQPPDILLTDIGMPRMNGLELIDRVKALNSDVSCVILSCHDEFSFAQKAVRLGVNEYILKETMTEALIQDTLIEITKKLKDHREINSEYSYLKRLATQDFNGIQVLYATGRLESYAGLDFDQYAYVPLWIGADRHWTASNRYASEEVLLTAMHNIVDETVSQDCPGTVCFRHSPRGLILLIPDRYDANELLRQIQQQIQKFLKITVSCLVGWTCQDEHQLHVGLRRLLTDFTDAAFYSQENSIMEFSTSPRHYFTDENLFENYAKVYDELYRIVLDGDLEQLRNKLNNLTAHIRRKRYRPNIVKEWFLKLLLDLQLKSFSSVLQGPDQEKQTLKLTYKDIDQISSLDELSFMVHDFLQKMIGTVSEMRLQSTHTDVVKAQRYVMRHLDKKITMEEVAGTLHLNTSYFSRLFKKETGENFSRYVMKMKMERAKDYLRTTNKTVEEISLLLGYENKGYFLKLFKLYTGMTPSQYAGRELVCNLSGKNPV